jgi:hypothetical protein
VVRPQITTATLGCLEDGSEQSQIHDQYFDAVSSHEPC